MSQHESTLNPVREVARLAGDIDWLAGAVSGAVATVVMGVFITVTDLDVLRVAISGLYGQSGSLVVGWGAHLLHGSAFGMLFAAVLSDPALEDLPASRSRCVLAGAAFGLALAVVAAGIIMPIWLGLVGLADAAAIPFITLPSVAWHLVYGTVLGAAFASVAGR